MILIVIFDAALASAFIYRKPIFSFLNDTRDAFIPPPPCSRPVTYSIGSVDEGFGKSRAQFQKDIDKAINAWEMPSGMDLFEAASDGNPDVVINLIFDYRQQSTIEVSELEKSIKTLQTRFKTINSKYNSLTIAYNEQKASISNSPARASNEQIDDLNALAREINATVTSLNQLKREINSKIESYKNIGSSTASEFDEGIYIKDASGIRINVYQFEDTNQLVRLLAHELGHVIGLNHINDEYAIMYRLNEGTNLVPTDTDMEEFNRACQIDK